MRFRYRRFAGTVAASFVVVVGLGVVLGCYGVVGTMIAFGRGVCFLSTGILGLVVALVGVSAREGLFGVVKMGGFACASIRGTGSAARFICRGPGSAVR